MPRIFAIVIAGFLATGSIAQEDGERSAVELWKEDPMRVFEADEVDVTEFEWLARPVVIFANSPNDPRTATAARLAERSRRGACRT